MFRTGPFSSKNAWHELCACLPLPTCERSLNTVEAEGSEVETGMEADEHRHSAMPVLQQKLMTQPRDRSILAGQRRNIGIGNLWGASADRPSSAGSTKHDMQTSLQER